jgi:phosphate transport system substrate-binding protein
MPFADLKNADGNFVTASLDSVSEALNGAKIPDDFRFSMINAPGAKSYPIASCTWLLVYQQQKDAAKGKALVDFLKWAYGPGEDEAKDLDYARLPSSLVDRVTKAIDTIKY